jgi:hypothetical protein
MTKKILVLVQEHDTTDEVFLTYKKTWLKIIQYIKDKEIPMDVLFLNTDESIDEEYKIIDDTIYSKYEENYWDALLIKVMNGFDFFMKNEYDLVFKTNLSTIINVELFYNFCNERYDNDEIVYDGFVGHHNDFAFCSGAGMLLNKNCVNILIENKDKISKEWTDDIFFGHVLNKLNSISPNNRGLSRFDILSDINLTNDIKNFTHIRIKIRNNNKDIHYTNEVYNILFTEHEYRIINNDQKPRM